MSIDCSALMPVVPLAKSVATGFEKTAANFTLAFQRVRRDAKSIRCCLGGQPEFSFHAPTSVSGDPLNAVQLGAERLFTSL